MIKLFKFIFKLVAFVVAICFILLLVVFFISFDDEKPNFTAETKYNSIPVEVGSDLNYSLDNIYRSNYEDNYVELSFSVDTLNGFLTEIIRNQINENYLITDDSVMNIGGASLDSIFFVTDDDSIGLKIRVSVMGFYKTTLSILTKLEANDSMVVNATFSKFSLGNNISVDRKIIENVLNALAKVLNGKIDGFNINKASLSINIKDFILSSSTDTLMLDLISSSNMSISIKDSNIVMKIDTSKLFKKYSLSNSKTNEGINDTIASALANPNSDSSYTISLTTDQFNYLISNEFDEALGNLSKTYEIGENIFSMSVIPNTPYYDVFSSKILLGLKFNSLESEASIDITNNVVKNGDYVSHLNIEVGGFKIGDCYVDTYSDHINSFSISGDEIASLLFPSSSYLYNIVDINFDDLEKTINITII